jgi:hypothetical protein
MCTSINFIMLADGWVRSRVDNWQIGSYFWELMM